MASSDAARRSKKKYQVTSIVRLRRQPAATRNLTVFAQDPQLTVKGRILTASTRVPGERVAPGPRGARVHVVDYDASTDTFYDDYELYPDDQQARLADRSGELRKDARFHAQNVYAIVMNTLNRFESALGRRVRWAFNCHQIKVVPHAFAEANAFYSRRNEALLFGYFQGKRDVIHTCLSHDVVAHETTHALLDGLRSRLMEPSSPDQAAFHEAFADIIAILSVLAQSSVVSYALEKFATRGDLIARRHLAPDSLRQTFLLQLAEEMGEELNGVRGGALRASANIVPDPRLLDRPEYKEPHRRGEILVAAMLHAYLAVWDSRIRTLGAGNGPVQRSRAVEDGVLAAERMTRSAIRALDYMPPVDVQFPDFLSALLTADLEMEPDDRLNLRPQFRSSFAQYGIRPVSTGQAHEAGTWDPPHKEVSYERSRFVSMQRDPDEVFRFIWENREALEIERDAYTYVQDVRPSLRIGEDGFTLQETVAEYVQILTLRADELHSVDVRVPDGMPGHQSIRLYGGGTLVFNEYGQLKLHIGSGVRSRKQDARLKYLWNTGALSRREEPSIAQLHRERNMRRSLRGREVW